MDDSGDSGSGFHIDVESVDEIDAEKTFDAEKEIGEDEAKKSIESTEMGPVEATMFFRQQHADAVVEALQQRRFVENAHTGLVRAGYVGAGLAGVNALLLYQLGHELVAGGTATLALGVAILVFMMEEPPGPRLMIPDELIEEVDFLDDDLEDE